MTKYGCVASLRTLLVLALGIATLAPARVHAQVELFNGFGGPADYGTGILNRNDDQSTGAIDLTGAFSGGLRFYGGPYTSFFVNNNGNITFNAPVYMYTPNPFPIAAQPMIAPYWGDVDTSSPLGLADPRENLVYYHLEPGRLVVTWYQVGYFSSHNDLRMNFQLIVTNATDCGSGDFDVEFRYNRCEWVTGDASGGSHGHGGTPAQAGFDAGNLHDYTALPGSFTENIINVCTTSNIGIPGDWEFSVRAGAVVCREDLPCTVMGQEGACSIGRTQCVANVSQCQAIYAPTTEFCDGVDNDCDGTPDDGMGLCPSTQACVLGACVDACFEGACPTDYTCERTSGRCVETACIGMTCPADQRCEGGACVNPCNAVVCPHGQQCISGSCIDPCAAVTCDADHVCNSGICVQRCPCHACPPGDTCLANGSCMTRGCDVVTCGAGDYCFSGACHDACDGVHCPRGQECALGQCVISATHDAGVPPLDAGTDAAVDASSDAQAQMDAGMVSLPDAGHDASHGPTVVGDTSRSCGCRAGGESQGMSGITLLAGVIALVISRRRVRR